MAASCPICSSSQKVEKVSTIVRSGTSSGVFSSTSNYTTMVGTQTTNLARILTPPEKPKSESCLVGFNFLTLLAVTAIVLILLAFFLSFLQEKYNSLFTITLIAAGLVTVFFFIYNSINRKNLDVSVKNHSIRWNRGMQVWERLYYCYRDDIVFDPSTHTTYTPSEVARLFD